MDDRQPMTPARLADALEKAINDPDTTADMFGEYARWNLPTILSALRASDTGRSEAEAYEQAESKIFARRFGSLHAKPCRDPNVATCARYECQFAGSCQKTEARAALHPPAGQGERT